MGNPSKITRVSIPAGNEEPFVFFGIVTSEPDYTISLRINKKAGISLRHSKDEVAVRSGSEIIPFQKFVTPDHNYALVSNRSGKHFLLAKPGKIDLIFSARDANKANSEVLATLLRTVQGITAVFVFESSDIRDRNIEMIRNLAE